MFFGQHRFFPIDGSAPRTAYIGFVVGKPVEIEPSKADVNTAAQQVREELDVQDIGRYLLAVDTLLDAVDNLSGSSPAEEAVQFAAEQVEKAYNPSVDTVLAHVEGEKAKAEREKFDKLRQAAEATLFNKPGLTEMQGVLHKTTTNPMRAAMLDAISKMEAKRVARIKEAAAMFKAAAEKKADEKKKADEACNGGHSTCDFQKQLDGLLEQIQALKKSWAKS